MLATADPDVPRPSTPDPTDRTLSKRTWERGIQLWRFDLRNVALNLAKELGPEIVIDDRWMTDDRSD